jgi:hypothetical protein
MPSHRAGWFSAAVRAKVLDTDKRVEIPNELGRRPASSGHDEEAASIALPAATIPGRERH